MTTPDRTEDRVQHRAERTYEVAATPEEVWDAIATADGLSAWFVPTRLDPRVGGEVAFVVGSAESTGVVTAYSPTDRFAYEEPWPIDTPDGPDPEMLAWIESIGLPAADVDLTAVTPIATEFLVEATSGGSSVVRVVTSSYGSGADWENEFFTQMVADTIPMFDRLTTYLNGSTR